MSCTKSERRFYNILRMRLSHIDLEDNTPAKPEQVQRFIEEMEQSHAVTVVPRRHPHKKVNK